MLRQLGRFSVAVAHAVYKIKLHAQNQLSEVKVYLYKIILLLICALIYIFITKALRMDTFALTANDNKVPTYSLNH